ncbi:MAG: ferritin [candidate division Zixibacteria bacterium]
MIGKKMQKAISDQITAEFYSSYLYLAMSAWCETQNLKGFAGWMRMQSEEEKEHAFKLFDYLVNRGGNVMLGALEAPPGDFDSVQDVFEKTLAHEKEVTASIHKLNEMAMQEKDYATSTHLQWFITEQVEEEASAEDILNQIKMVEGRPGSLFYIDRHVGKRE